MKKTNFNIESLLIASYEEAKKSDDPSTQVGAVLVNATGTIVSTGFNIFPIGVKRTEKRTQRPNKYLYTEHAERNAILNAAKMGIKTDGLIMVCAWAACADCARAIINSGIKAVIRHPHNGLTGGIKDRWNESMIAGDKMFYESGVIVIEHPPIHGHYLLRDGILQDTADL